MLALEGYRLLDLSRLAPGPLASRLLADMGMEVVKVEELAPRGGRERDILTPVSESLAEHRRWAAYNSLARNKRSVALDLRQTAAREVFHRLVSTADVVLEGYRPGVAKKMGIDYESVRQYKPNIIYCSISGYGQDGPYRDLPGHDPNYCALSGVTSITSDAEGNPVGTSVALADFAASLHAVIGIETALLARQKTGRGQYIDVSMCESAMSWMVPISAHYFRDGRVPRRGAPGLRSLSVLKCKDGRFISLQNSELHLWEKFCRAIGRADFIPLSPLLRSEDHAFPQMVSEVKRLFLTRTRDEWFELLKKESVCVAPVLEINEVFENEHIRSRKGMWDLEHSTEGRVRQIGFPIKFSDTPAEFRSFAPLLGEDSVAVLRQLGYDDHEISEMESAGAIKRLSHSGK